MQLAEVLKCRVSQGLRKKAINALQIFCLLYVFYDTIARTPYFSDGTSTWITASILAMPIKYLKIKVLT